jgi:GMP synthase-like glutamine amidotransferase
MPEQPVFGIQFHPEYTVTEGEESLANKIKKGVASEWIFNPGKGEKLYNENVGKVIFGNFFGIAGSRN